MIDDALAEIARLFDLGKLVQDPVKVPGGLSNQMWRIDTDRSSYAVKELSSALNLKEEALRNRYDRTETIAHGFAQRGIPAVGALRRQGRYLILIDGTGFLVYPWIDGCVLPEGTVSEFHALQISGILAKLHGINLEVPEFEVIPLAQTPHDFSSLIRQAERWECSVTRRLQDFESELVVMDRSCRKTLQSLNPNCVVSHADLDPKNVLWTADETPILIDWESAQKLNPTYEIINVSLDWSGILTDDFDHSLFIKMLKAYGQEGGQLDTGFIEPAFQTVVRNWLDWLVSQIHQTSQLHSAEEKVFRINQVDQTLSTLLKLNHLIPELTVAIRESL
jgi:thiamine kinase-like enzyme